MAAPKASRKPGRQPADRLRAEVATSRGASMAVLDGHQLRIKPQSEWRSSAFHALRVGDFQDWARTSLEDDGFRIWLQVDPKLDQIDEFFDSWTDATGEEVGESAAS